MARVTNAILSPNAGINQGKNAPMVDLAYGGMMGYTPELTEWVSNQAYIRKNVICLLVEAPSGFNLLDNPTAWVQTLRALVELHPLSIEGLNMGLEVEFANNPVGGSGQIHEDFTDVKRTVSNVVFRWSEKYGMPIASFISGWITNLMMDPDSKIANVATLAAGATDLLSDQVAATMIFIEPDPTFTKVVKSWLVTNMMPKKTGEIIGKRDMNSASENTTYDVDFTGITQVGVGVDTFAQTLLSAISLTGASPMNRPAFVTAINADITATQKGFSNDITAQAAAAIVP